MDKTCRRCLLEVSPIDDGTIQKVDLSEIGLPIVLEKLYCTNCKECVALRTQQEWEPIEACFNRPSQLNNGWQTANSVEDSLIVYVMSQIMYNENAADTEPIFDIPDPDDPVKIFWRNGQALGYYSLKLKGSFYAHLMTYSMHILDTAFIIPRCRRQGLGKAILRDMMEMYPGENLGISTPISTSMRHVLQKVMDEEPSYEMKIWEVVGAGDQGDRRLVYYSNKNTILR